ncbi:nodulation protein NfeD [Actinomyces bowdenii]|uniref:nodulation protein NfeD n=1 Tax=Actinomyces bowdenii TaxID=131109 RepID=UPI001ABC2DB0|nr:nodulation protein NfeD [Actinomyces bowdenii]
MSIFAWCTLIGCAVLLLGILLDGPLDELLPDGALPVLAVALAVFGAVGMGVEAAAGGGPGAPAVVLWGAPAALALAAGGAARWAWSRLRRSMPLDAAPPSAAELVGQEVSVLWWKEGTGEVRALARGHQLTLAARSPEPLSAGQSAWVLDIYQDDALLITPWSQD